MTFVAEPELLDDILASDEALLEATPEHELAGRDDDEVVMSDDEDDHDDEEAEDEDEEGEDTEDGEETAEDEEEPTTKTMARKKPRPRPEAFRRGRAAMPPCRSDGLFNAALPA